MKQNRILLCAISFLIIFNILTPVLYAQQRLSEMSEEERNQKIKDAIEKKRKESDEKRHPKVDLFLTDLEDEYKKGAEESAKKFYAGEVLYDDNGAVITKLEDAEKKGGGDAAKKLAKRGWLKIKEGNKINVEIILKPGIVAGTFDATLFEQLGGEVIHRGSTNHIGARIPIDKVRKIADEVEEIDWIETPTPALPEGNRSEGLGKVGFSNYSAAGIRGAGVKVAVIDVVFKGFSNATSAGELPGNAVKVDCTGSSCATTDFSSEWNTDEHGTAVAEIVHDMAPEAQLYLLKVDTDYPITLKNAVTYSNNAGVKVINHSAGWFNRNFNDGQCFDDNPVCSANMAYTNGAIFVKSAGNYATQHYSSTYTPKGECHSTSTDPNEWAQPKFTITSDEINAGKTVSVYLTWDAWPGTDQDYDIKVNN